MITRPYYVLLLIIGLLPVVLMTTGCESLFGPSRTNSRDAGEKIKQIAPASPPTIDAVFMVDQSQSMGGGNGEVATDPQGMRFSAVKYAIENLKLKGTDTHTHRIGLVEFGTEAPSQLSFPMTATNDNAGLDNLKTLLKPKNLVWTSFTSVLQRATELLEADGAFTPNHRPAIIIFTDGTPEDQRKLPRDRYFSEIREYVQAKLLPRDCALYIVAVDASGSFWREDKVAWEQITSDRAYSISNMDDLKSTFNDIVRDILQLPKLPKDVLINDDVQFVVGPYLDQLEFHIFGPVDKGFELRDPSGEPVQTKQWTSPDYSIYTVHKPVAGTWTYKILAKTPTQLTVYRNEVPVRPRLVLPRPSYPAGKPIQVIANVQYADGSPLKAMPAYPLRVTARIDAKDGHPNNLTLSDDGDGTYSSNKRITLPIATQRATVDIVLHAGTSREYQSSDPIIFTEDPYFDVTVQSGNYFRHYGDFIAVKAQILEKGKKVSGDEVFQSPTAVIRAQLTNSPSGEQAVPVWLDPISDAQGSYQGTIPFQVQKPGRYTITYAVGGTDARTGKPIAEYTEDISVNIAPTWLDRAIVGGEYLAIIILCLGAIFIVVLLAACIWAIRLPRMPGGKIIITYVKPVKPRPIKAQSGKSGRQPAGNRPVRQRPGSDPGQASQAVTATMAQVAKTTSKQFDKRLQGKYLICWPWDTGRFLFMHGLRRGRRNRNKGSADMLNASNTYIIWYCVAFPIFRKVTCQQGHEIKVGQHHTLKLH